MLQQIRTRFINKFIGMLMHDLGFKKNSDPKFVNNDRGKRKRGIESMSLLYKKSKDIIFFFAKKKDMFLKQPPCWEPGAVAL